MLRRTVTPLVSMLWDVYCQITMLEDDPGLHIASLTVLVFPDMDRQLESDR